jgi:hypothetical protein
MSTNNINNENTDNNELMKDILKKYPKLIHLKEALMKTL